MIPRHLTAGGVSDAVRLNQQAACTGMVAM
jgi:hypothetical protein